MTAGCLYGRVQHVKAPERLRSARRSIVWMRSAEGSLIMNNKPITSTQKEQILSMRSHGISLDTIARALTIPYHQIQTFITEFEYANRTASRREYLQYLLTQAEFTLFALADLIQSSDDSDKWHYEKQFDVLAKCYASADLNNLQVYLPIPEI